MGADLCSQCGSYQRAWKNHLRYYSTIVGLATFVVTALVYLASWAPELWKLLTWRDRLEILDLKIPGPIVIANIGDGDLIVRKLYWSGKVGGVNVNETLQINKRISVNEIVETTQLTREHMPKVPIARYMTTKEVPKELRLKVLDEALSVTNVCYDFRVSLAKERGVQESEAASKEEVWSIPLDVTITFYSLHSNTTLEENVSALGFVMKGEDDKCHK